jgi:hypothetical protein
MSIVALSRGSTPKLCWANVGVHTVPVRNSTTETSAKKWSVSSMRTMTIPTVVTTEIAAQAKRKA